MGHIETQILAQYPGRLPDIFKRFIDDCLGITTCSRQELQRFIDYANTFHPSIQFTSEISDSSLSFLDIKISIQSTSPSLHTTVYYKPTDAHSYLLFSSSHPPAMKESIPYSQFLRLRRLCSSSEDYAKEAAAMTTFFSSRGYPQATVQAALARAKSIPRQQLLQDKAKVATNNDRSIATLTYHPHNIPVKNILLRNFTILKEDPTLQTTFALPPLVAFKRDKNLGDHLMHSAFHSSNPSTQPGNFQCKKPKCKTCDFLNPATSVQGPSGHAFHIRSHFTCQTQNVVYILTCTLCPKMYIGETYRSLNERFKEHRDSILTGKDTPVANHFNSDQHHLSHIRVAALWRNGPQEGHYRKHMESQLISRLGTLSPQGLNVRE